MMMIDMHTTLMVMIQFIVFVSCMQLGMALSILIMKNIYLSEKLIGILLGTIREISITLLQKKIRGRYEK